MKRGWSRWMRRAVVACWLVGCSFAVADAATESRPYRRRNNVNLTPEQSIVVLTLLGVGAGVWILVAATKSAFASPPTERAPVANAVDVGVVRVALDGRARVLVQSELARIAQGDRTSPEGRLRVLADVSLLLRQLRDAWIYGGAVDDPVRERNVAEVFFERHVQAEQQRIAAIGTLPRSHLRRSIADDAVLVTIVVATRSELLDVRHANDGESLRKALEAMALRAPDDLVGIEILWHPADAKPVSVYDLEAAYPPPALFPISNALAGMTFCACGWPYPAELQTCPRCGTRRVA